MLDTRLALGLSVALVMLSACDETTAPAPPVVDPPGFGTPTVDGTVGTDEWSNAQMFPVLGERPEIAGSVLYVMNDATTLYFGLRTPDPTIVTNTRVEVRFDDGGDGTADPGDDAIGVQATQGFYDVHMGAENSYTQEPSTDGEGALLVVDGGVNAEMSHPLSSGDPDDIAIAAGDRIHICLRYFLPDFTTPGTPSECYLLAFQSYMEITLAAPN